MNSVPPFQDCRAVAIADAGVETEMGKRMVSDESVAAIPAPMASVESWPAFASPR